MLWSGNRDFVSLILCHNKPSAGGIGNHLNSIIDTAASGNASGKIRHSTVVFGFVLIWYECCCIDIFHRSVSCGGGEEVLPPALSDFFSYVAENVFIEVSAQEGYTQYYTTHQESYTNILCKKGTAIMKKMSETDVAWRSVWNH